MCSPQEIFDTRFGVTFARFSYGGKSVAFRLEKFADELSALLTGKQLSAPPSVLGAVDERPSSPLSTSEKQPRQGGQEPRTPRSSSSQHDVDCGTVTSEPVQVVSPVGHRVFTIAIIGRKTIAESLANLVAQAPTPKKCVISVWCHSYDAMATEGSADTLKKELLEKQEVHAILALVDKKMIQEAGKQMHHLLSHLKCLRRGIGAEPFTNLRLVCTDWMVDEPETGTLDPNEPTMAELFEEAAATILAKSDFPLKSCFFADMSSAVLSCTGDIVDMVVNSAGIWLSRTTTYDYLAQQHDTLLARLGKIPGVALDSNYDCQVDGDDAAPVIVATKMGSRPFRIPIELRVHGVEAHLAVKFQHKRITATQLLGDLTILARYAIVSLVEVEAEKKRVSVFSNSAVAAVDLTLHLLPL